jgi:hypothetical protein
MMRNEIPGLQGTFRLAGVSKKMYQNWFQESFASKATKRHKKHEGLLSIVCASCASLRPCKTEVDFEAKLFRRVVMQDIHIERPSRPLSAALLLGVLSLTALFCPVSSAHQDPKPRYEVAGTWVGKFPREEGRPAEADDPVAVEIAVKSEGDKVSGTCTFYVIVNRDNKPQVKGSVELELINPKFDGTLLTFSVKTKGQQADKEAKIEMRMKLTSATEGELENLDDSSSPLFKMKRAH